jgi:hypothetical protein
VGEAPRPAFPAPLIALAAAHLPLADANSTRAGTVARGYCSAAVPLDSIPPDPNNVHNTVPRHLGVLAKVQ